MIQTDYGAFDGVSWERLCQSAFKIRHGDDYQRMPASPGDFGFEGWTTHGHVFQCYCPEKNYTQAELYEALRRKITDDIPKLKQFKDEIARRIGNVKIAKWLLVTPIVEHNKLYAHARKKEAEAREWSLEILHEDFTIFLQDAGYYAPEFETVRAATGSALQLGPPVAPGSVLVNPPEKYDGLIDRKNRVRLRARTGTPTFESDLASMNSLTEQKFLSCDAHLATIERTSPQAFQKIIRVIGHYAEEVAELMHTWEQEPNVLVQTVKTELGQRLEAELGTAIGHSDARRLADLMTSRWLAVCQLDFIE